MATVKELQANPRTPYAVLCTLSENASADDVEAAIRSHIPVLIENLQHDLETPQDILKLTHWGDRIAAYCATLEALKG